MLSQHTKAEQKLKGRSLSDNGKYSTPSPLSLGLGGEKESQPGKRHSVFNNAISISTMRKAIIQPQCPASGMFASFYRLPAGSLPVSSFPKWLTELTRPLRPHLVMSGGLFISNTSKQPYFVKSAYMIKSI